jgi:hypothetical protein
LIFLFPRALLSGRSFLFVAAEVLRKILSYFDGHYVALFIFDSEATMVLCLAIYYAILIWDLANPRISLGLKYVIHVIYGVFGYCIES